MASTKQPPLSNRTVGWNIFPIPAGSTFDFTGSNLVVKRITVSANATGSLRLLWNNGSSFITPITGGGPFTIEPNGQYNYDYAFTVDAGLMTAGFVLVEFCAL